MTQVLVVDDSRDNRVLISSLLSSAGYNVACASSVLDAVRQLDTAAPDAVLLDMGMPDSAGLSGLAALREDYRLDGVPIVIVSVMDPPGAVPDGSIRLPLDPRTFVHEVERLTQISP